MLSFTSAWRLLDADRHRSEFYRMWRVAAAAGFTVPAALDAMGQRETADAETRRRLLLDGTRRGEGVATVVARAGERFEPFERALLTLGDESGRLEQSLRLLADFYSRKHQMMRLVRKRMAYPLFTGICATVIAPIPLVFLGRSGAYLLLVAAGLAGWLAAGGAIVGAAARRYGRGPALVRARLARALATAIEAGLPLGRALRLAADAAGDPDVQRYVQAFDERALTERPIADLLAGCPHMAPEFLAMLKTAEHTGDFATSMTRLAELYEDGFR